MNEAEKKEAEAAHKEEKKRLKAYNDGLKKTRETELPTLYEPLVLNCELLFALASEVGISEKEQAEIDEVLRTGSNGIFLVDPINDHFSFAQYDREHNIELKKDEIVIPVSLMSSVATITVEVEENGETITFDDCVVSKVERKGETIAEFYAHVTSKLMSDYTWTADSRVTVTVTNETIAEPISFRFKVSEYSDRWVISDKVVFEAE